MLNNLFHTSGRPITHEEIRRILKSETSHQETNSAGHRTHPPRETDILSWLTEGDDFPTRPNPVVVQHEEPPEPPAGMTFSVRCPRCNTATPLDSLYCKNCGERFTTVPNTRLEPVEATEKLEPVPKASLGSIAGYGIYSADCPRCGFTKFFGKAAQGKQRKCAHCHSTFELPKGVHNS